MASNDSDGAIGHLEGTTGVTSAYGDYNVGGCDPEALVDFVSVTSALYPQLHA